MFHQQRPRGWQVDVGRAVVKEGDGRRSQRPAGTVQPTTPTPLLQSPGHRTGPKPQLPWGLSRIPGPAGVALPYLYIHDNQALPGEQGLRPMPHLLAPGWRWGLTHKALGGQTTHPQDQGMGGREDGPIQAPAGKGAAAAAATGACPPHSVRLFVNRKDIAPVPSGCRGRTGSLWSESSAGWGLGGKVYPASYSPAPEAGCISCSVPSKGLREEASGIPSVGLPLPRCALAENCIPPEIAAFLGQVPGRPIRLRTCGTEASFPSKTEPESLPLSIPHTPWQFLSHFPQAS